MQTLTRRHMVDIEDYDHMQMMDENVKWMKLTHLLSYFSLNLKAPFCTSTFTSKQYLDRCILCVPMPQMIPLLTLTLVHIWYEESTPRALSLSS
jgi:hypothetical protein